MKSGGLVGLIAGAFAGVTFYLLASFYVMIGIWEPTGRSLIESIVLVLWNHVGINAFWGGIFGLFFAIAFDRIPGKGIIKGLFIGLIYSLFSSFYAAYSFWAHGSIYWATTFLMSSFQDKYVYGIIFALLYKK